MGCMLLCAHSNICMLLCEHSNSCMLLCAQSNSCMLLCAHSNSCMLLCAFICRYFECKKTHAMDRIKLSVTVQNILALAPAICTLLT